MTIPTIVKEASRTTQKALKIIMEVNMVEGMEITIYLYLHIITVAR